MLQVCLPPPYLRSFIYRLHGYEIDETSRVLPLCFCGVGSHNKGKLTMGAHSYINYRCFLDLGDDIIIGSNVAVAFGCTFINSTHSLGDGMCRAGKGYSKKIIIEDGCWIGANTTIMPGVTIRKGCVIGSNSFVIKDTDPNGLYVGHPAKKIKDLSK